jgi:ferredoxin
MIYEPLNRFRVPVTECIAPSRYEARVEQGLCDGCQNCVDWCQFDAIELDRPEGSKKYQARIDAEKCMGCGVCVLKCEPQALSLHLVRPAGHIPQAQ